MARKTPTWQSRINAALKDLNAAIPPDIHFQDETPQPLAHDHALSLLNVELLDYLSYEFPGEMDRRVALFERRAAKILMHRNPQTRLKKLEKLMDVFHGDAEDKNGKDPYPFIFIASFDLWGQTLHITEIFALMAFKKLIDLCHTQGLYVSFNKDNDNLFCETDIDYEVWQGDYISDQLTLVFNLGIEPLEDLKELVDDIPVWRPSLISLEGKNVPTIRRKKSRKSKHYLRIVPPPDTD